MLSDLRNASRESSNDVELRAAASRLLREQFLFAGEPRDRMTYELVVENANYFDNLFDALGWRFHREPQQGFVGVTPTEQAGFTPIRVDETLVLLVLSLMFEEAVERHDAGTEGVTVTGNDIANSHAAAGRPAPLGTRMRDILKGFQRRGLVKAELDGPLEEAMVTIRSTIRLVTGETVRSKLSEFCALGKELDIAPQEISEDALEPGTVEKGV